LYLWSYSVLLKEVGGMKRMILTMMMAMFAAVFFFVGYAMAIIAGIWWPTNEVILGILLVLGLLMGLFSYKTGEVIPFLVAAVAIIVIGTTQPFDPVGTLGEEFVANINDVFATMAVFIAPAAAIQAIRGGIALIRPGIDGIKMAKAYRDMKKLEQAAQAQE